MPAATTSYCNAQGCWYRYSTTSVQFLQNGVYYFWGDEELGEMWMNIAWGLVGTHETESANVDITHEVDYPVWSGSLFNGAKGVTGRDLHDCPQKDGPDEVPANTTQYSPSGWCTLTDTTAYDHNMVLQYSWQAPGTDGYYWAYAKSVVSHSPTLPATSYTFDAVNYLPASPATDGWDE